MENENNVQAKDVEIDLEKNGKDIVGGNAFAEYDPDNVYEAIGDKWEFTGDDSANYVVYLPTKG